MLYSADMFRPVLCYTAPECFGLPCVVQRRMHLSAIRACTSRYLMLKCCIMIRLILFAFWAIIIAIATAFVYPVYRIVRKFNTRKGDWIALRFVQWGFRLACVASGTRVQYKGLEYLPEDGEPVVLASNHRGLFDAILIYRAVKGLTGNLSKKELKSTPIIGWWIKAIYGVLLDRKDHKQGMQCVLECINHLNNGISMLVFPEGTRSHVEGELLMFHRGTFKIATKPGVPIVPVAVSGTGDIFDDHRPYIKARRAIVEFCEPIETRNMTQEEKESVHDVVKAIIQERILVNKEEVD